MLYVICAAHGGNWAAPGEAFQSELGSLGSHFTALPGQEAEIASRRARQRWHQHHVGEANESAPQAKRRCRADVDAAELLYSIWL